MSDPLMEKMLGLPEFEVTDFKQNNAVMISMFSRIAHQADGLSTLNNSSIGTCGRNRDHLVRIYLPFAAQYVGAANTGIPTLWWMGVSGRLWLIGVCPLFFSF